MMVMEELLSDKDDDGDNYDVEGWKVWVVDSEEADSDDDGVT